MSDDTMTTEAPKPENEQTQERPLTWPEKIKKVIKEYGLIIIAVFAFRSVFFEPFRIPSGSMIPTLMIGDFILVNKFSYGFKVPFSDMFSDPIYIFGKDNPERGDVVVFKYPKDPSVNYIKRVIGIPGDTIEIRDKIVYINDKPINTDDVTRKETGKEVLADMDDKFRGYNLKLFETKTGEHEHLIQHDSDNYYKTDYDKREIPNGKFFVMGDNRDFSYDSRYWGFVPHGNIKGKAIAVWFSMIFPFSGNNFKFRPWRIGTVID